MTVLKSNIATVLQRKGANLSEFLQGYGVERVEELTVDQLSAFCQEEDIRLDDLFTSNFSVDKEKAKAIKLLILDVDGVMTDGGMYFTENGDQMKKYNAKDGMAIMDLKKHGIAAGIISSGFKSGMVKARADLLKIEHFYVGRQPKIEILNEWCEQLKINLSEVAMIGDDVNDLSVIREVGFSACPADAVPRVKSEVDVVLTKDGGRGCVRELIDFYFLDEPLNR